MEDKRDTTRYRLRNIARKNYVNLQRADAKQLLVPKQAWSPSLDQQEPELKHIKVEQEELWGPSLDQKEPELKHIKVEQEELWGPSLDQKEPELKHIKVEQEELWSPSLDQEEPELKHIKVEQEELWSTSLDQEEPELSHIKGEQEELWTSQEGEQLQGLKETDIKVTNLVSIKSEKCKEEPSPQSDSSNQSETKSEDSDDDRTEPDAKQLLVPKQAWGPSLDQEEPELKHIKVEQEELWTSQEGDQLQGLKETDIKVTNFVSIKSEKCKEEPSPQSDSSDQSETKSEDRDDDWTEPGSKAVTLGKDRTLNSSAVAQLITTSGSKLNRARSHCCQQCGKSFSRLSDLMRHHGVHTGEKPYLCQQCAKSFSRLSSLKTHQSVHTGEKPYHCQPCGKSFRQLSGLKSHQLVHSGEKPFHCQLCGKSFNRLSRLKTHLCPNWREAFSMQTVWEGIQLFAKF